MAEIGKNQTIVMTPEGLQVIQSSDLKQALEVGWTIPTKEQIEDHNANIRHPVARPAGAAAYGAAKGITAGLGPAAYIKGAELLGAEESARQQLKSAERLAGNFPITHKVGEVAGMIAPLVLSGGAAAPEIAAAEGAARAVAAGGAERLAAEAVAARAAEAGVAGAADVAGVAGAAGGAGETGLASVGRVGLGERVAPRTVLEGEFVEPSTSIVGAEPAVEPAGFLKGQTGIVVRRKPVGTYRLEGAQAPQLGQGQGLIRTVEGEFVEPGIAGALPGETLAGEVIGAPGAIPSGVRGAIGQGGGIVPKSIVDAEFLEQQAAGLLPGETLAGETVAAPELLGAGRPAAGTLGGPAVPMAEGAAELGVGPASRFLGIGEPTIAGAAGAEAALAREAAAASAAGEGVLGGAVRAGELPGGGGVAGLLPAGEAATADVAAAAAGKAGPSLRQRLIGGLPKLYSEAGEAVGKGVEGALGGGALGRVAGAGSRFATEGALYAAGEHLSENAIQNKETTAQSLLAAAGEGALYNGILGAGLGGIGEVGGLAKKLMPKNLGEFLDKKIADAEWEGITGDARKITKDANRYVEGGHRGVIGTLKKKANDWFGKPFEKAAMSDEELLAGASKGLKDSGSRLGDVLYHVSDKSEKLGQALNAEEVVNIVKDIARKARQNARFDGAVTEVENLARGMEYSLGLTDEFGQRIPHATSEGYYRVRPSLDAVEKAAGILDTEFVPGEKLPFTTDYERLHYFRQLADSYVSWAKRDMRWELMHDVRSALERKLEGDIERIAGKEKLGEYRQYKREYQAAKYLKNGIEGRRESGGFYTKTAGRVAGMVGGAVGSFLGGGFPGGAVGYGVGRLGGEAVKTKAPFVAAGLLRQLQKLAAIEHVEAKVDDQIAKGIAGYVAGATRIVGIETLTKAKEKPVTEETVNKIHELAANPDATGARIEESTGDMQQYAPGVNGAVVGTANQDIQYLASIAPKQAGGNGLLMRKRPLNAWELNKFNESYQGVVNPLSALRDMQKGNLTQLKVDAMQERRPDILQKMRNQTMDELWKQHLKDMKPPKLDRRRKKQLSILMGAPIDDTFSPGFTRDMQQTMDKPKEQGEQKVSRQGGGRRPIKMDIESYQTSSQQIESEEG